MSYTYLQEQGAVSSAECFSDIPQFVLSRLNLTGDKSCCSANGTESYPGSPYGMMSAPLTENLGVDSLMSSAVDFPAKIFPQQGKVLALKEVEADCGGSSSEWFAKYDQKLSLWKTRQPSLFEGLESSWEIWPQSGTMQSGTCFQQPSAEPITCESESLSLPTPKASRFFNYPKHLWLPTPLRSDNRDRGNLNNNCHRRRLRLGKQIHLSTLFAKAPCPLCVEGMMGWPMGWSQLAPLAMDKFQQWLSSHGKL